jgi:hypothetical protein
MTIRSRAFDQRTSSTGSFKKTPLQAVVFRTVSLGNTGACTDVSPGWGSENALTVDKWYRSVSQLTGAYSTSLYCTDLSPTHQSSSAIPDAEGGMVDPDWVDLAFDAAAASNPQKPAINLPAFLGESADIPSMLADIPRLIFGQGRRLLSAAGRGAHTYSPKILLDPRAIQRAARRSASEAGSQYVGLQFGWKPLIGDLTRMLELQRALAQQLGFLLRLKQGRSVKRRVSLPTVSRTATSYVTAESQFRLLHAHVTDVYRSISWITARWAPTVLTDYLIPDLSDAKGLTALAARLATGMTRMGLMQAWWELLPWSWLIDWWFNLGRLLAVVGNSLALQLVSLCYMRTSYVTRYYAYSDLPEWITLSGGPDALRHVRKMRKDLRPYLVLTPPPPISLPLFSGRQMGILGGLLAQAQSKGFRR